MKLPTFLRSKVYSSNRWLTEGLPTYIETLDEDINSISERGELEEIPGVGANLAAKIREILGTGRLAYLEKLKQETPEGVLELAEIGGIGPKKALLLSRELGITDREKLEEAAKAGKIRTLAGFRGEKREEYPEEHPHNEKYGETFSSRRYSSCC